MTDGQEEALLASTTNVTGKPSSLPDQKVSIYRREPTLAEVEEVQKKIRSHGHHIIVIDTEIARLQKEIASLRQRRASHEDSIKRCKGAITLARRLPHGKCVL
jgi:predicted  nucleic acid-binding Zn-ribbon protein